ncbi:MAG TPA: alpha/beta hydrolase [Polyangiaceae bacterium]|nr:alpha/beta hydrolase [Polyangiaceae bacterium]
MATLDTQGISLYYELHGTRGRPPVLLISGLGGAGTSWGSHVERFAQEHFVILPDQRGTGRTTRSETGYSIAQIAKDMASLVQHLDVGPVHVVGTSTGGTIAQLMALDHADAVRSVVLASSFARPDAWLLREFELRRKLMAEADMHTLYTCYALFLFSPRYTRNNADRVRAWVDRCAASTPEREISLKRIDMIMAHDVFTRLGDIRRPTLVIGGDQDFCTPPQLSDELAEGIPGAERVRLTGGHMIHDEDEKGFFEAVRAFIAR